MAYTRTWDNSAPPGTAPANTLDTIIQAFREDTQQRISSILKPATDINTDPLQLKTEALGAFAGTKYIQPFCGSQDDGAGSFATGPDGTDGLAHLKATGTGFVQGAYDVAGVINGLPTGAQVTLVNVYGYRVSPAGTSTLRLYTVNVTSGVYSLLLTFPTFTGAFLGVGSGPIGPFIMGTSLLVIRATGLSSSPATTIEVAIAGVRVDYTIASGDWIP